MNTPPGGKQAQRPNRRVEILAKDFTSVEQAAPLRYIAGTTRVGMTQIAPVFGFRNEAVSSEAGK
jgi:hypothetical protein